MCFIIAKKHLKMLQKWLKFEMKLKFEKIIPKYFKAIISNNYREKIIFFKIFIIRFLWIFFKTITKKVSGD